jgi:hypothetical protein
MCASKEDEEMLKQIQDRFAVNIPEMPEKIDVSLYSIFLFLCSCLLIKFVFPLFYTIFY